jgi:hypothetical protein
VRNANPLSRCAAASTSANWGMRVAIIPYSIVHTAQAVNQLHDR